MTGLVALALVALIALAGTALADNFAGSSSQGGFARVKTNEFNVPELLVIGWRAPCDESGSVYRAKTSFGGPFRQQSRNHFRSFERYRSDLRNGFKARVTVQYEGNRTFRNRWSGTFSGWVVLRKNGKFFSRCRSGLVRWTTVRN